MRNLSDVINKMLGVIPHTEVSFIRALESLQQSVGFSAPEIMGVRWNRGAEILSSFITGDPNQWLDWQKDVARIWVGEKSE